MIVGHLGRDPETKTLPSGMTVGTFSVATKEVSIVNGQRTESTEWHRIVVWDKLAENCGKYLAKGSLVYVDGRLKLKTWESKTGEKKSATEIIASNVQFLTGKKDATEPIPSPAPEFDNSDIPF